MGRKRASSWGKLTRQDLRSFDDYGTKAILYAMDHGGVGKISNRGHAMIKAPAGEIMGVAPDTRKARQVIAIGLRKNFGNGGLEEELDSTPSAAEPEPEPHVAADLEPTLECPDPACEAVFVTEGARYAHIHREHFVCEHPGCSFTRSSRTAVNNHHRLAHLGIKPRKGRTTSAMSGQGHDLVRIDVAGRTATFVCECGKTGSSSRSADKIADEQEAASSARNLAGANYRAHRRAAVLAADATKATPPSKPSGKGRPSRERARSRDVQAPAAESPQDLAAVLARIDQRVGDLYAMEQRIAQLEAENTELRATLAQVRKALGETP